MLWVLRTRAAAAVLAGVLALAGRPPTVPAAADQVDRTLAFIVNKANPVDNLAFQDLRKVFLGERTRWPDGKSITVVMQDQGQAERGILLRQLCHMTEADYRRYILQAAFTGSIQSEPKLLSTSAGVVKFVSFVPSAIGYAEVRDVTDAVKVLKVDGLLPGQPRYKFNGSPR